MDNWKKISVKVRDDAKKNRLRSLWKAIGKTNSSENADTSSKEPTEIRPARLRIIQNYHLVWLDEEIDDIHNDKCRNTIIKLRQMVNTVNTFINADECIDFISEIKDAKAFMIISGAFSQTTVPIVHDMTQVRAIYIFGDNRACDEQWVTQWPIVKGVFTDIESICQSLKQAMQECDQNSVSMSFVAPSTGSATQNLDQLDSSFVYTQILKDILFAIDYEREHLFDFITYCREQFAGNITQLKNVDKLEREYPANVPIWWYTSHCFLYSMLNRALHTMEVDLIIKMDFFVRDLHGHITKLHYNQYADHGHSASFTVFRGQGLSQIDFDQLRKTQGGLLSFNNFLSTSTERPAPLKFAHDTIASTNDLVGILFVMSIDPSIPSRTYANVRDVSCNLGEEEILFSMHSIFRIGQIKQLDNNPRLWQVDLALTSDNDPQLRTLTERIREEVEGSTGWCQLAKLMINLGHLNKAEELCEILLDQATDESEIAGTYFHLALIKNKQGKATEAVAFNQRSLQIDKKTLASNHPDLATDYGSIALLYAEMGEYPKALSSHEKALEIRQRSLPENHPDLAILYTNIGFLYNTMREYSKVLPYYEKALEICQNSLPANHPDLANSYNNIGSAYYRMGDYSKALSYCEQALEIQQKTLPDNHPDLETFYNNIATLYDEMGEYSKALSYYEKELEIRRQSLPANHPDLATSYKIIGLVYNKMQEYPKALSYYEKALEICQNSLPVNHRDLVSSYNHIGSVYNNMGEYSKALSYFEKDLEISEKTLPANHPDLATSYNNIGSVNVGMGEYSKALSSFEHALEIRQKTLPDNHTSLAASYKSMGFVYNKMDEYSKALPYYEKSSEILQKTLSANHPDLANSYSDIGFVYSNMGEYSKALSYFEKDLDICQKSLPENHSDLATSYNNIGLVYEKMGEYSTALPYYEKVLEISQKSLPENDPDLATAYNNVGWLYKKTGNHSKALSFLECALNILQRVLPSNHPDLRTLRKSIKNVKENCK